MAAAHVSTGGGLDGGGVGVGGGVGFLVGVGVGLFVGVGVGMPDGGGVPNGVSVGTTIWLGVGVGRPGKDWGGSEGPAVGVVVGWTKIGSDETGVPVGEAFATPPPPGRRKLTSSAPTTNPVIASARAAMIGTRLVPDDAARRLGYVTPAASPATGKRWWQRRQKVARAELLAPQLGQIKELVPRA